MSRQSGQSTLEYVLVLAVVILAIVAAAAGPIRNALNQVFNDSANRMTDASNRLNQP